MELTTEAYIDLLEKFNKDYVVLIEKVKSELLQWIGHVFWSLKHAQHILNEFLKQQHIAYQQKKISFYPWVLDALKDDMDVHLIITKFSRGPAYDFHFVAATFNSLRQASDKYPEQMVHVNIATMVAIDEMSPSFRVLEILIQVVQFLARLGCSIISLDGFRKKVVDEHTGRCAVLHRPHPSKECRRDQLDSFRMQLEDWLLINYEDVITFEERNSPSRSTSIEV